jgi:hypothetical protein
MFNIKASAPRGQQPDYRELEITPRQPTGSQLVEVLLNDGTVARLKLLISTASGIPTSYDLEPNRTTKTSDTSVSEMKVTIPEIEVMRKLLEGTVPEGMRKASFDQAIWCRPSGLYARLKSVVQGGQYKAFVIEFIADSRKSSFKIHEENFVLKGRDLSRSPLIHLTSRVISRNAFKKSVVTMLTDPSVHISRVSVCDLADQVEVTSQRLVKNESK